MSTLNMIQASEAERAQLPESPVGLMELTDANLADVGGGHGWYRYCKHGRWHFHYHFFGSRSWHPWLKCGEVIFNSPTIRF